MKIIFINVLIVFMGMTAFAEVTLSLPPEWDTHKREVKVKTRTPELVTVINTNKGLNLKTPNRLSKIFYPYIGVNLGLLSSIRIGASFRFRRVIGIGCSVARFAANRSEFGFEREVKREYESEWLEYNNSYVKGFEETCYVEVKLLNFSQNKYKLWVGIGRSRLSLSDGTTGRSTPLRLALEVKEPKQKYSRVLLNIGEYDLDGNGTEENANGSSIGVEFIF